MYNRLKEDIYPSVFVLLFFFCIYTLRGCVHLFAYADIFEDNYKYIVGYKMTLNEKIYTIYSSFD